MNLFQTLLQRRAEKVKELTEILEKQLGKQAQHLDGMYFSVRDSRMSCDLGWKQGSVVCGVHVVVSQPSIQHKGDPFVATFDFVAAEVSPQSDYDLRSALELARMLFYGEALPTLEKAYKIIDNHHKNMDHTWLTGCRAKEVLLLALGAKEYEVFNPCKDLPIPSTNPQIPNPKE